MLQLVIQTSAEQANQLSDFLAEEGALAVSLADAGDQPLFQEKLNETPLWRSTQINALFAEDFPLKQLIQNLEKLFSAPVHYQIESIVEQNWVEKTQENFPARCFANRLWVVPSGVALRINPGLGFGTGAHPSTALCLEWLAQQPLAHKTVIDYGCGSGILGLGALALGAEKVWAVDHDPQALTATRNNAELNSFAEAVLSIVLPEQLPQIQADIILANILANPLCELAPQLISYLAPHGQLVLSGFLAEEIERIVNAYSPALELTSSASQENWIRLVFCRTKAI